MEKSGRIPEIDLLRAFIAISKTGDFASAAEKLKTSEAVVIIRLRQLEEDLEVSLFRRTPNGMTLTPAGESLLPEAHTFLAESGPKIRKRHGRGR